MTVDHFTEQNSPPIAQLRNKIAKLMRGVGHRQRRGTVRNIIARENRRSDIALQSIGIKTEFRSQLRVEFDQTRFGDFRRQLRQLKRCRHAGKTVVKWKQGSCSQTLTRDCHSLLSDFYNQLAEILAFQKAHEGTRRIIEPLNDIFAELDLSVFHPAAHFF